jgi:hypothetical protein
MVAGRALDPDRTITVVSGIPRSGTSMMIQMLEAAGVEHPCDAGRLADIDNPRGYFELEATKRLSKDASFLTGACAKAVKVVASLLTSLPAGFEYRVIFIDRNMEEIMASQQAMMEHADREQSSDSVDRELARAFHKRIAEAKRWLEDSGNVHVCYVSHADVFDSPKEVSAVIADFLEATGAIAPVVWTKDERQRVLSRMAAVVEPDLYRQRRR